MRVGFMHAYERVAAELAAEIEDGVWEPGAVLPTIPDLMERFGVSRITVRGGIEELARRGLVFTGYAAGRRGTIVRSTGRVPYFITDDHRARDERHDAFAEAARRAGKEPGKSFEMRFALAPADVARRLGVPADQLTVVRISRQLLDGEPWSRETTWYARDLAEEVGIDVPQDIARGTVRVLADAGYPEIAHVDEVTDETASPEDAEDLSVPVGSPLLVHTRIAAAAARVTRVTRFVRLGGRVRLVWQLGDPDALDIIPIAENGDDQ